MSSIKVAIGFITYGEATLKYLPEFMASLSAQTWSDFKVLVWDNSEPADRANETWLKEHWPRAVVERAEKNLGFAAAANRLLNLAEAAGAEYFFLVNPDTYLSATAIARLVEFMDGRPDLTAASPKVLRWDFVRNKKTEIIDSCGLAVRGGFKFVDVGQGLSDQGQFDQAAIIGPSGCSAWWRLSSLTPLKFDERFFMYKEDCDLAYQMFLAGKKAVLAPQAIVYHDRSVTRSPRRAKSRQAKQWSFFGQLLLVKKYWSQQTVLSKILISSRLILLLAYALVFEPYLLLEITKVKKLKV